MSDAIKREVNLEENVAEATVSLRDLSDNPGSRPVRGEGGLPSSVCILPEESSGRTVDFSK